MLHLLHLGRVGETPWQLKEETFAWWHPGEIAQSHSAGKAGDGAASTPRRQRCLVTSPTEEVTVSFDVLLSLRSSSTNVEP